MVRLKSGTHSAFKSIVGWNGTKWFIEVSKYFDTLDHYILE